MGLFRRKKEQVGQSDFLGDNNKISNGNNFEMYQQAKAKEQKLDLKWGAEPFEDEDIDNVDTETKKWLTKTTPQIYYQYYQLCSYFTNLFKYEVEDIDLYQAIKKVQTIAFFNGKAGLYWSELSNKFIAVSVSEVDRDKYGTIIKVKINTNYNNVNGDTKYEPNIKDDLWVDKSKVIIYRLKNNEMSCYIWCKEYVEVQHRLLNQMGVTSLISNKIIGFTMSSKNDNKKSLLSFLNPNRFYIYSRHSNKLSDSVKILNEIIDSDISLKYLEIYRQTMDIYSDYIGIRNNTEYKKERNTVDEVNAQQGWFDAIEQEFYFNFKIFMEELNQSIYNKYQVTYQEFTRSNEQRGGEITNDIEGSNNIR